jgi:hypothetical protein
MLRRYGSSVVIRPMFNYLGNLNVQTLPPWLKCLIRSATSPPHKGTAPPQPESTDKYCSPSISQVYFTCFSVKT